MGNFIRSLSSLFSDKATAPGATLPAGWSTANVSTAADLNSLRDALYDLRNHAPRWKNVLSYDAVGDGEHDDTDAIQETVNSALAPGNGTIQRGACVYLPTPPVAYRITRPIVVDNSYFSLTMGGDAWNSVIIKADEEMPSMFEFTGGPSSAAGRMTLQNLTFDGNSLAERAILGPYFRNAFLQRMLVKGTTVVGIDVAQGWNNSIVECEVAGNAGNGISLGTAVNNTQLVRTKVLDNEGIGLIIESGPGPAVIDKCDFERNKACGIFIASGAGVGSCGVFSILDSYFEGNAENGHEMDIGTYHADIILNGSGSTSVFGEAYSPQVVNIERNLSTSHYATTFIQYLAGECVRIVGNVKTPYSLVSQSLMAVHAQYRPMYGHIREGNRGFNGLGSFGTGPKTFDRVTVTYGEAVTPDLALATEHVITPTDTNPFYISAPTNTLSSASRYVYQEFSIVIRNATGGALGAATWDSTYKLAAWTQPANGYSRTITFRKDGHSGAWREVSRTADVPN